MTARIYRQKYPNAHFFRRCRRRWGRRALRSGSFTAELGDQTRLAPLPWRNWHRIAPLPSLRCPRVLFQVPQRRLRARVLLMPPRQPDANDLQVQVSALRQSESP
jgi:hypothetical protein